MVLTIVFQHFADAHERAAAERHLSGLSSTIHLFFLEPDSMHWIVGQEQRRFRVSLRVEAPEGSYDAVGSEQEWSAAVSAAFDAVIAKREKSRARRWRRGS